MNSFLCKGRKGRQIRCPSLLDSCDIGTWSVLVAKSRSLKYRKIIPPRAARQSDETHGLKAKGLGEAFGLVKRFLRNHRDGLPLGCGVTVHAKFVELIRGLTR